MDDLGLTLLRILVLTIGIWLMWRVVYTSWGIIKAYRQHALQRHHVMANIRALLLYFGFFIIVGLGVLLFNLPL